MATGDPSYLFSLLLGVVGALVTWLLMYLINRASSLHSALLLSMQHNPDSWMKAPWMNLGLWAPVHGEFEWPSASNASSCDDNEAHLSYDAACEAMGRCLAEMADLRSGSTLLDVGFGWGRQDLLFLSLLGSTPATGSIESIRNVKSTGPRIIGVDIPSARLTHARSMITQLSLQEQISLLEGSATALPLDDAGPGVLCGGRRIAVDRVLALDCAYHFHPKDKFLRDAYRCLQPGGVLALCDLVLRRPIQSSCARWAVASACKLCNIPASNVLAWPSVQRYREELLGMGYVDVRVVVVTRQVLAGFGEFVARHYAQFGSVTHWRLWIKYRVTAWLCRWLVASQSVDYLMISARKPSST